MSSYTVLKVVQRLDLAAMALATPLPSVDSTYTPYYCEENVLLLLRSLAAQRSQSRVGLYALFITNPARTCLLFEQGAGAEKGSRVANYVVWDYHVVAITVDEQPERRRVVTVQDLDSTLGSAVPLEEYLSATFRPDLYRQGLVPSHLASRFRLVPAQTLFDNFASDRSHMLVSTLADSLEGESTTQEPAYIHLPPSYPPLVGPAALARGERNNLFERFLDVRLPTDFEHSPSCALEQTEEEERRYGVVIGDMKQLARRLVAI